MSDSRYVQELAIYQELVEASRDELKRSQVASLPQALKLQKELGIPTQAEFDAWCLHARRRFIRAVENCR